jgi:hypothetical protein
MWIWPGQKTNVKKVCSNSPSQRGEGGVGMFVPIEGQLLHKQGGLTLGYSRQAWKSTCKQQECPPQFGHCGQLGHGGYQGHWQNCSQGTCLNNQFQI